MSTTVRVKPSNKNGVQLPPPIPLSMFDLLMPPVYVPIYIFFQKSPESSSVNQFTVLEIISALADVLELFPPLAGSIQRDESGKLTVHSNRRGSDFSYEIRKHKFLGPETENLCPRDTFPDQSDNDSPLISIKLTSFSCGSHVMVVSFAHMLIDLSSVMDFLRAFAGQAVGGPLTTVPKRWTRNPLEYFPDAPALSQIPGFTILPPGHPVFRSLPPPPTDEVFLYISSQKLSDLKSALGLSISDFQLLTALLWRASATCCSADVADEETLCLGIAANARERSPDKIMAKEHYFGNFVTDVCVSLKKSDLLTGDIPAVAGAIKAAIKEQLSPEHVVGKTKTFQSVSYDRLLPNLQTRVSFWSKDLLDTEDLHFGLVEPGKGRVTITPGNDVRFPLGNIHISMATEEVYRAQLTVPEGKGDGLLVHGELAAVNHGGRPRRMEC